MNAIKSYLRLSMFHKLAYMAGVLCLILVTTDYASGADLPVRPSPGLPLRPPTGIVREKPHATVSPGAYILLRLETWDKDWWSVVQWQGQDGVWHKVEGWQGTPNQSGRIRWWIDAKDTGKGPFRWIIYSTADEAEVLWAGPSFFLPDAGTTLETVVSVNTSATGSDVPYYVSYAAVP